MPILRKQNFPRNPLQTSAYMLLARTVSHGHLARGVGKCDFVDERIGGPNKLALETKEVKGCS